jgi:hypothetical protein
VLLDSPASLLVCCRGGTGAMLRIVMHRHQVVHRSTFSARALCMSGYNCTAAAACNGIAGGVNGGGKQLCAPRIHALGSLRSAAAASYTSSAFSAAGEHRCSPGIQYLVFTHVWPESSLVWMERFGMQCRGCQQAIQADHLQQRQLQPV